MGRAAVREAMAALEGEPVERNVVTDTAVLTPANVDDPATAGLLYLTGC